MLEGKQPAGYEARSSPVTGESGWADMRHTVMELLRILMLRKWMLFVPFCLTLTAALVFSHRLPRKYKATTVFERRTDVATSRLAREGSPHKFKALLWSFSFDIVDPDLWCEVVDDLGWARDYPRDTNGELAPEGERMRRDLAKSYAAGLGWSFHLRTDDLDQIELTYTADNAETPRLLVERVRDAYLRRTRARIMNLLEDARAYYRRQLDESQAEEARLAEEMLRFEIEYPGIDPSRPGTIAEKVALLENNGDELERRAWELEAEIASREAFIGGAPLVAPQDSAFPETGPAQETVPNPRRADLERRIRQFETDIADLQLTRRMTDQHPRIEALRQGMRAAAEALANEPERVRRETAVAIVSARGRDEHRSDVAEEIWDMEKSRVELEISSLQANRQRIEEDRKAVEQQIASLEQMRASIFERQREYEQIRAELERARSQVKTWADRFDELERTIDVELHSKDMGFSVVVPASPSSRPVSPRFSMVVMLSVLLALGVGVGVVLLAELMDRKFRTVNQVVRATGLPILETIGEILTPAERRSRFVRQVVLKPALAALLILVTGLSAYAAYTSIEHPATWSRWRSHLAWHAGDRLGERAVSDTV
ncbi:MAG: hypothetical protein JSU68_14345 [Phycisphaerales bacterium]|nr:MAG: hypothetical protein JSU68_14345 [Phycisphaerales bacterium]